VDEVQFKVEMDIRINKDDEHLMHFIPDRLQRAFAGSKVIISNLKVTRESEQNTG
jgi:hypothetical protein